MMRSFLCVKVVKNNINTSKFRITIYSPTFERLPVIVEKKIKHKRNLTVHQKRCLKKDFFYLSSV